MNRRFVHLNVKRNTLKNNMGQTEEQKKHQRQDEKSIEVEDEAYKDHEILDEPTPDMSVASSHDSLKELIEKNIKWSQVLYNQNRGIKRRLTMMVVGNYIRLFLILTPIILGIIFLPPFLSDIKEKYTGVFGQVDGNTTIQEFIQNMLKSNGENAEKR